MEYLRRAADAAGLRYEDLFVDPGPAVRRVLPKRAGIVVGSLGASLRVSSAMRRGHDLLHVNTSLYPRIAWRDAPVIAAAGRAGLPVLLQVHGGRLANLETAHPATRWLWARIFGAAAAIGVFPGPQLEEFECSPFAERLRPMLSLVPRTVSVPEPSASARLLFLGSLTEAKGVWRLLGAFERLRREGLTDTTLTIAGSGPLEAAIRGRIETTGLEQAVRLVGFVSGDHLRHVMEAADVFVLPSRAEGFPLSFLESAERGMACLVTRNSAVAELFEHDREIVALPTDDDEALVDALRRVSIDPELRTRLGRAVQHRVRAEYTIEAGAPTYRRMYEELVASHRSQARS